MKELTEKQAEAVRGLRDLADRLEEHPELIDASYGRVVMFGFCWRDGPQFARLALALGNAKKEMDDEKYRAIADFGPLVQYQVVTYRDTVCERVVLSSREIEEEVPDPELAEAALADVPMIKTTRTVEEVEWHCPPSLHELAAS